MKYQEYIHRKIQLIQAIPLQVQVYRAMEQRIAFTNGCFDVLHAGHIHALHQAASFGDKLIVGLNSDDSVRRLKGEKRPINPQSSRAIILASLFFVDHVVLFDEDTPDSLIRVIKPDVLIKGEDYKKDEIAGANFVKSYGGQVFFHKMIDGYSTTAIANQLFF